MTSLPLELADQAACKGADTSIFFPVLPAGRLGRQAKREALEAARKLCDTCPVKAECWLAGQDEYGIWSGTLQDDRGMHNENVPAHGRERGRPPISRVRNHGTRWGYVLGCRCDPCAEAASDYDYEYRRRKQVSA